MKSGTLYASKVKKAYNKLRQSAAPPEVPETDDPLRRLAIGIVGVEVGDERAVRAIDRLLTSMVDWNEVRVSTIGQVHRALGDSLPHAGERAEELIAALQAVYDKENRLSLDKLRSLGRRDARQYLEKLNGVNEYALASVLLWSLGGHAIPVDDRLLAALRSADLIHPNATREEVQAFLERHVSANQAKEFCLVMRNFSGGAKMVERAVDASASKKRAAKSTS